MWQFQMHPLGCTVLLYSTWEGTPLCLRHAKSIVCGLIAFKCARNLLLSALLHACSSVGQSFSSTSLTIGLSVFTLCRTCKSVFCKKTQGYEYPKQNGKDYLLENEKYCNDFFFFFLQNHKDLVHCFAVIFILHKEQHFPVWLCIGMIC